MSLEHGGLSLQKELYKVFPLENVTPMFIRLSSLDNFSETPAIKGTFNVLKYPGLSSGFSSSCLFLSYSDSAICL